MKFWFEKEGFPPVEAAAFHASLTAPIPDFEPPTMSKEAGLGMLKFNRMVDLIKLGQMTPEELEQQAMIDPQIQASLDYEQAVNENAALRQSIGQFQQQSQQLQQQMAQQEQMLQQAQMQSQQLGMQLQQEQASRQMAVEQAVQAKDQSLQAIVEQQQHREQIMGAADQLASQLKNIASKSPTQQAQEIQAQQAQMAQQQAIQEQAMAAAQQPGGTKKKTQKETQEAQNAGQEAEIQAQQAQQAQAIEQAEQQAMAGGQPGMMPPDQGGMVAQGSAGMWKGAGSIRVADLVQKLAWGKKNPGQSSERAQNLKATRETLRGKGLLKRDHHTAPATRLRPGSRQGERQRAAADAEYASKKARKEQAAKAEADRLIAEEGRRRGTSGRKGSPSAPRPEDKPHAVSKTDAKASPEPRKGIKGAIDAVRARAKSLSTGKKVGLGLAAATPVVGATALGVRHGLKKKKEKDGVKKAASADIVVKIARNIRVGDEMNVSVDPENLPEGYRYRPAALVRDTGVGNIEHLDARHALEKLKRDRKRNERYGVPVMAGAGLGAGAVVGALGPRRLAQELYDEARDIPNEDRIRPIGKRIDAINEARQNLTELDVDTDSKRGILAVLGGGADPKSHELLEQAYEIGNKAREDALDSGASYTDANRLASEAHEKAVREGVEGFAQAGKKRLSRAAGRAAIGGGLGALALGGGLLGLSRFSGMFDKGRAEKGAFKEQQKLRKAIERKRSMDSLKATMKKGFGLEKGGAALPFEKEAKFFGIKDFEGAAELVNPLKLIAPDTKTVLLESVLPTAAGAAIGSGVGAYKEDSVEGALKGLKTGTLVGGGAGALIPLRRFYKPLRALWKAELTPEAKRALEESLKD